MPPGNVRLLLSPLDEPDALDWSDSPAMADLRTACRPATEENVKSALLDELPQCDGDLLWIFWAGHGYLGPRQELMLPCADARPSQIRHLNLDSALRWWRTDLVKQRRFPLQAALVDSCRVDAPATPGGTSATTTTAAGVRCPAGGSSGSTPPVRARPRRTTPSAAPAGSPRP
ncbi:hypothetical protein WKI68_10420 [Streptomyces sp. MS1.HAVA.3]|uniref:Caspase family protein n=1 Tax=Streptomyces caledonius TaxID=3134107 RepID=A0ABU8U1L6_9ACTN